MSDAIVLTSQQPGDPRRGRRSSAPSAEACADGSIDPVQSVVPTGFAFAGTVAFDGRARIDGRLIGCAEGRGRLEIGAGAEVQGDVRADELIVAGHVEGDLVAGVRIELLAQARVRGAVRTSKLVVREGATIDGPCSVESSASQRDSGTATDRCAG